MKRLTEHEIKKMISESMSREQFYSKYIFELFPEKKGVHVWYKISHTDFASHIERENQFDLISKDRLYVQISCPNRTCTQGYFTLTSEASECLRTGREVRGKKFCHGKEDYKYYDHNGFTCDTTLEFVISPL